MKTRNQILDSNYFSNGFMLVPATQTESKLDSLDQLIKSLTHFPAQFGNLDPYSETINGIHTSSIDYRIRMVNINGATHLTLTLNAALLLASKSPDDVLKFFEEHNITFESLGPQYISESSEYSIANKLKFIENTLPFAHALLTNLSSMGFDQLAQSSYDLELYKRIRVNFILYRVNSIFTKHRDHFVKNGINCAMQTNRESCEWQIEAPHKTVNFMQEQGDVVVIDNFESELWPNHVEHELILPSDSERTVIVWTLTGDVAIDYLHINGAFIRNSLHFPLHVE